MKKKDSIKNYVKAVRKKNREEEIEKHGKQISFRTVKAENPKAYKRSKFRRTEENDD